MASTSGIPLEEQLRQAQLPALPQSAIHLLELSRNPDNGPAEYAVPIEADPGLAGQILRFVNSSFFGFRTEVTSVRLAINLVGVRTIRNFALWSAVFGLLPTMRHGSFKIKHLWQDSLRRALFARQLGRRLGADNEEDLFTAALLQDLAVPILLKEIGEPYAELIDRLPNEGHRLSELEQERFGWTHADAGAIIARRWKLPESLVRLIEGHATVDPRWGHGRATVSQLAVSLSAILPASAHDGWREKGEFLRVFSQLPPTRGNPDEFFVALDKDMAQFSSLLKLTVPSRPLVSYLID